jgi:predicted nuclease of predicted toxin-antitoxin system
MKFLLDANIPYSAMEVFPADIEVVHVRDVSLESATDRAIGEWAKDNRAIIVTRDLDFANTVAFPPEQYYGMVILRLHSSAGIDQIQKRLEKMLAESGKNMFAGAVVIVEENRLRRRYFGNNKKEE